MPCRRALLIDAQNAVQNTGTIHRAAPPPQWRVGAAEHHDRQHTGSSNAGLITAIGAVTHVDSAQRHHQGRTITTSGGVWCRRQRGTLDEPSRR
jgi:hypothetical protein